MSDLSPFPAQSGATRAYHAMIKPVGAICNLDCRYCYYLHKEELLGSPSQFRITDEILETLVLYRMRPLVSVQVGSVLRGASDTALGFLGRALIAMQLALVFTPYHRSL